MDLNSPLFDRIRVKPDQRQAPPEERVICDHPGCNQTGEFRAPMGRLREGQYFCFCLDHVREYNASYNYFNGMTDDAVARYQKDDLIGHRPTWRMGVNRAGGHFREDPADPKTFSDPLGMFRQRSHRAQPEAKQPRYGLAATKALATLGLDDSADAAGIKARYKDLVKRLHPDANGGDRSSEDKLREIIRAYNHLKSVKIV
ncbi:MAG: DnaJ domain-containing protein [Beijerinckiaceae bacterium]